MDWQLAIEKNRQALKGVLAVLVAMAGLSEVATSVGSDAPGDRSHRPAAHTLPRHLHRFVLRLLRPAEAAARRLIIVAARGLVVELAPPRTPKPRQPKPALVENGLGQLVPAPPAWQKPAPVRVISPRSLSLPLFDPLKRFGVRRRYVKPRAVPSIRCFDPSTGHFNRPYQPAPLPPSPDDPLDARRLHRRLEAVAGALEDLPHHAKRLARWQARRDAAYERDAAEHPTPALRADPPPPGEDNRAAPGKPRIQRLSPMRPGRPPGWRRRPDHPVYEVLSELHGLAIWARERPDTS